MDFPFLVLSEIFLAVHSFLEIVFVKKIALVY